MKGWKIDRKKRNRREIAEKRNRREVAEKEVKA
jgi:hypothetical protein